MFIFGLSLLEDSSNENAKYKVPAYRRQANIKSKPKFK
jgi:hypothetical protein